MIKYFVSAALALALALPTATAIAGSSDKTLRFIALGDLRVLDPIWTTATITRNYGYMVYDTLFSLDRSFRPQPQMVDTWRVSDDRLTYTFALRDELKFHDGEPVKSADCVASLARWSKRDVLGQMLAAVIAEYQIADDKNFSIVLKKTLSAAARSARQTRCQRALHHAGASGKD